MNSIVKETFSVTHSKYKIIKPLMIGCSGGGGHISAIQGINGYLKEKFGERVVLTDYSPVLPHNKPSSEIKDQINTGINITYAPYIGVPIRTLLSVSPAPVLPTRQSLEEEIKALSGKEQHQDGRAKNRQYVDMLLDAYPAGYESAAIWNVLQRNDETNDLKKLISFQSDSDEKNYKSAFDFIGDILTAAAQRGEPYSEIISTQAMALPALCDIVRAYNQWIKKNVLNAPEIVVHQYMTDLPTLGAVHFFNSLQALSSKQQRQMKLYAVGLNQNILAHFFPTGHQFAGVIDIPAQENPMVRPGFKNQEYDNSAKYNADATVKLAENQSYEIAADEKIAAIMLGSQAGNDTFEYIESLLKSGMQKVFVFGGKTNAELNKKIQVLLEQKSEYLGRVIALGNQNDKEISALMTRSNILVIRGGGLSVMEQLAMNHNKQQTILIHHANSEHQDLSSGISWEDENVNTLIETLSKKDIHCKKTTPERAVRDIVEARLLVAIKSYDTKTNNEEALAHLKFYKTDVLQCFVEELDKSSQFLPIKLVQQLQLTETIAIDYIDKIKHKLDQCKQFMKNHEDANLGDSLKIIQLLMDILNDEHISAPRRLRTFNEAFNHNISNLDMPKENIIYKLIDDIILFLAEYFEMFLYRLNPIQQLSIDMKKIILEENGFFAKQLESPLCDQNTKGNII